MKLIQIWGVEKTESYYNEWKSLSNTQVEMGEYVGLFKYSDAIIHDSASFIVEYLYMNNPSMLLVSESNSFDDMFDYVKKGLESYEQGHNVDDIEVFIINVINGIDCKKEIRREYILSNLYPPNGKSACENIIDAILV